MELKKTPLYTSHKAKNAKMAPFGGWEMPIQYSSILEEHKACRSAVALFDTCHMGEFYFQGDIKASGLEQALSLPVQTIPIGKCRYGFLLNEQGGIIDDMILYRLSEKEIFFVVNAATTENDFLTIRSRLNKNSSFVFENISSKIAKIDVQGPLSRDLLMEKITPEIKTIPYFGFKKIEWKKEEIMISRTGYTGELGYELYASPSLIVSIWEELLKHPSIKPAGLGARDVLRLEMGYSLYGSDLDEKTTPIEAGLEMFVDYQKDFVGREALLSQKKHGITKTKIAFQTLNRRAPRSHYRILSHSQDIGEVTSGVFSPVLNCGIGIGYVKPDKVEINQEILLSHEGITIEAKITSLPFIQNTSLRK